MKKLITGAVAAIAILLGFAACSGDLHENEVAPLYIEGVTSARVPMTKVSDTEQIYKFIYSKNLGGWHNTSASIEFKTMVDGGSDWSRDWGAPKDETVVLKVGDEEYTPLLNREADGVGGAGPGNIEVYDLVEGQEYTIRMQVDIATLSGKIRIEGLSVAAPDMQIIVSTDAGGKDAVKIPMTRGGTTYTYEFIAAETKTLYYYFYCSALNTTYYVNNNKLEQVDEKLYDAHGNLLNADGDTVADNSYAPDGWKKANMVSIVKEHKYSIEIVADETYQGFNGTIKYEVKVDDIEEVKDDKSLYTVTDGIFKDAVLIGQWNYTDNHDGDYAVDLTDGAYTFMAQGTSVEFKVLRDKSEDTMAWGGKVSIKPGTNYEPGEAKTLTYKTTLVLDKENGFAYTAPKEEKSALKEVEYITADGLKAGTKYTIFLEPERLSKYEKLSIDKRDSLLNKLYNDDLGKFKICLAEAKELDLSAKIQGCVFKGSFNGWTTTYSCNDFKDGKLEIKGLVNEKGGTDFECGIFEDLEESTYMYRNATIECKNEAGNEYGTAIEFTEDSGSGTNAHITGLAPNAKFDIKITTEDGKVYVAVKVTEAGAEDTRTFAKIIEDDYYIKGGITNDWWSFNVFATSEKTVVSNANDKAKEVREIFYGPFDKARAGEFLLTNGGVYYREITVKYLTGNNAYAQFVKDEGGNSKVDLGSDFPANMSNFYIVVKADSSSSKVWARIEPTNDAVVFQNQFLKGLTVSGWCRKWNDNKPADWVGTASPAENTLGKGVVSEGKYTWTAEFKIPDGADVIDLSVHSGNWDPRYESASNEKLSLGEEYTLTKGLEANDPGSGENGRGAFAVEGGKSYVVTYILEYNPNGDQTLKYKLTAKD
ncbi:MAG: hypothetical protein HDR34_02335 [Treponema sp.]|nr:hypothetical protein [Treponema sp.]